MRVRVEGLRRAQVERFKVKSLGHWGSGTKKVLNFRACIRMDLKTAVGLARTHARQFEVGFHCSIL